MVVDSEQTVAFSVALKAWYLKHHRPLLWRSTTDPYKIWLSEIILQQTRVAQGTPYYVRFTEAFPTVADLAAADEQEVLRLWQGLGYYSRARNMHFTARQVVESYGGEFPQTAKELEGLKGLGQYTAAAVASFAFGEAVPAVDGNVYRVLSRLFGIYTDILSNDGKKEFYQLAQQLIPLDDPATHNQAMIEFGAIQCVPASPKCMFCPFNNWCYAFEHGAQNQLPVKIKKGTVRKRYFTYLIIEQNGKLAMRMRAGKDIWKGLNEFFLVETESEPEGPEMFEEQPELASLLKAGTLTEMPESFTHLLTHQRLHVRFWWLRLPDSMDAELPELFQFFDHEQVEQLPKPILLDQFLKAEGFLQ